MNIEIRLLKELRESMIQEAKLYCTKMNSRPNWKPMYNYYWYVKENRLFVMCGRNILYYQDLPIYSGNKNK